MKNDKFQGSQTLELKQTWKYEHLKIICAFANTDGGILYTGIDDKLVIYNGATLSEQHKLSNKGLD